MLTFTFTASTRHATNGIYLIKHLNNVHLHPTIAALYSTTNNPHSLILKRLHHILPNPKHRYIILPTNHPPRDLTQYFLTLLSPHSALGRLKKHSTAIVTAELYNHVFEHENEHFHLFPSILSPHTSYPLIAMSRSCTKHRLTPLTFLLSIHRKLCLPIYTTQTGPLAPVDIMNMPSTETAPSAVNKVAKNKHITSLLWILLELYLLFLHKPATFFRTHPWQSNNCSTSAQTRQHNLLTFYSLPIPHHATIAHTPLLGQTSTSPGPRLAPRPTNLTLKTFSTQSLPRCRQQSSTP